jgi:hypothetical protein
MRKVLLFIFVLFLICCRKEPDCYECTTTFTVTYTDPEGSDSWSASDTRTKCGVTEDEIREYEKNYTDTITFTSGPLRIDTVMITVCIK